MPRLSDSSASPRCVLCALLSGLFAAVLSGCPGSDAPTTGGGEVTTTPVSQTAQAAGTKKTTPAIEPLMEGWQQPAVAIVLSGEQHGYVEPCGCSETQSGGLARRHDLFKQLRERGWSVVGYDLGGLLKRTRPQSLLKLQMARNAMDEMGYAAAGLGKEEIALGPDTLFTEFTNAQGGVGYREGYDLAELSANVVIYGTREIGMPQEARIDEFPTEDGGLVRVGVTSIYGQAYRDSYQGSADVLAIEDPVASLERVLPQLEGADVRVLLAHAPPSESRALAERFPQFDVVVTAEGPEDPADEPEVITHDDGRETWLLRVSQKGKYVGVLAVYPTADAAAGESPLRYELVDLDKDRFETSAEIVEWMRTYQQALIDNEIAISRPPIAHPRGTGYVGAEACGACHTTAYAIWSKSKHAHAFESLADGRPGTEDWWVDRQHDAECLACHVTGWEPQEIERFEGGFVSAEQTPHLVGNGCENCHGPGEAHTTLETELLAGGAFTEEHRTQRQAVKLSQKTAALEVCSKCHDLDNSPNFDFETYWPKVQHVGTH